MARINLDSVCCHHCRRPFDDIAVWVEIEQPDIFDPSKRCKVWKPACRTCYTFADMRRAKELFVCAGCGLKAHMPWQVRNWFAVSVSKPWVCSPRCSARQRRKDRHWKQRTCEACNKPFTSARKDARLCSNRCRQWTYRRRRLTEAGPRAHLR
jgi:hypothetical protein